MNVWMEDNASRYPNFLNSLKFIEHKALLFYFHLLKKKKSHSSQEINEVLGI